MFDAQTVTTNTADGLGRCLPYTAYYADLPNTNSGSPFKLVVLAPEQLSAELSVLTYVAGTPHIPATAKRLVAGQPQASADIENLRRILGLSVSTFANMFDVSRQAVYKWQAGEPMNQEHTNRLAQLREAAALLTDFAKSDTRALTRRKLPSGRTVVESIFAGENPIAVAQAAADLLRKDTEQREALDVFLGNRSKPRRSIASIVTPHAGEDLKEA